MSHPPGHGNAPAGRFIFRTLGALELTDADGTPVPGVLEQSKRLALLTYLCVARPHGFHRRDTIIGLLWAESGQSHARASLRNALHHLRGALGHDVIVSRGDDELAVSRELLWCDAVALHDAAADHVDAGNPFRGDLLAGFNVPDAAEFERWLDGERRFLRHAAARLTWKAADRAERDRDASRAIAHARQAYALDPDDEESLRRLLTVQLRLGDNAGALRAYDEFAERLAREYEAQPSQKTRALIAALKAAAAPAPTARPHPAFGVPDHGTVPPLTPASSPALPRNRRTLSAIAGAAVVAAVAGGLAFSGESAPLESNRLAIAPSAIYGADLDTWSQAVTDILSRALDHVGPLRTVPASRAIDAWQGRPDLPSAQRLGRETGAGLVLTTGLARVARDSAEVTADLVDAAEGEMLGAIRIRTHLFDLHRALDSLGVFVLRTLDSERGIGGFTYAGAGTRNVDALREFVTAVRLHRGGRIDAAREALDRALAHDSNFAVAWNLRGMLRWGHRIEPEAARSFRRAAQLNHGLAPADSIVIVANDLFTRIFTPNVHEARRLATSLFQTLEDAVAMQPENALLWHRLAEAREHFWMYFHRDMAMQHAGVAFVQAATTRGEQPSGFHLAMDAVRLRDHDRLREYIRAARAPSGHAFVANSFLWTTLDELVNGAPEEGRLRAAHDSAASSPEATTVKAMLASWPAGTDPGLTILREAAAAGQAMHAPPPADFLAAALMTRGRLREALALEAPLARTNLLAAQVLQLFTGETVHPCALPLSSAESASLTAARVFHSMALWGMRGDTASLHMASQLSRPTDFRDLMAAYPARVDEALRIGVPLFLALARGDTASAVAQFDSIPPNVCTPECQFGALLQAKLLIDVGRPADALRVASAARAFGTNAELAPYAAILRARAARALRRRGESREAYRVASEFLRDAEPALAPLVREAHAGKGMFR